MGAPFQLSTAYNTKLSSYDPLVVGVPVREKQPFVSPRKTHESLLHSSSKPVAESPPISCIIRVSIKSVCSPSPGRTRIVSDGT